jgi:hypothetical protein
VFSALKRCSLGAAVMETHSVVEAGLVALPSLKFL